MSKKNRKLNTEEGLNALKALVVTEPSDTVVAASIAALSSVPAVSVFAQVEDMRQEVDKYDLATKDLDETIEQVTTIQRRLADFRAALKSKIVNSGAITKIRVYVEKHLGDEINKIVEEQANSDAGYARMRQELVSLVAKANEMSELRQRANELEMEANTLFASVVSSTL